MNAMMYASTREPSVDRLTCVLRILLVIVLCVGMCVSPSFAQDDGNEPGEQSEEAADGEEASDDVDDAEASDRYLAVVGARVHTVSGPVLDNVTVLAKNGRIAAIGSNVHIPDEAEVIDATGFEMYPGLIGVDTRGILGGGNPDDSTDVFDLNVTLALAGGITSARTGNQVAKLTYGIADDEDMVVSRSVFETFRYDTSAPNQRRQVREQLDRIREYLRDLDEYNRKRGSDPELKEPAKDWIRGNYQTYLRLMQGEAVALVSAGTSHELLQFAQLSQEYGIRFAIRGAHEGWVVASELARADIAVILTPRDRVDPDPDLVRSNGSTIENARILHDHGVTVAFVPPGAYFSAGEGIGLNGLAGRDMQHLPMEAAYAVRGGMSNDDAIRALTLDAARLLGVDKRIGSIEVGKDADFVITDGHLLHYTTLPRWTIVNGRVAYDKERETIYQHIRTGGDPDAPPPSEFWPKRFNPPWLGE